ncbi:MAG TPA: hypothetical protein VF530_06415 [Planctomycetota bacterium]
MSAWLLWLGLALRPAQERERAEFVKVEVTCTALAGDGVYLDQGRDSGLEPGDRLRLEALEGPLRLGKVVSVSRTSARAELTGGVEGVDVGARGFVFVPKLRLAPPPSPSPAPAPPATAGEVEPTAPQPRAIEHPPWTAPPVEWSQDTPLLAPAHGVAPEDRPRTFDGLVGTTVDWTRDDAGDEPRSFLVTTLGAEGRLTNPFGRGGELAFDLEQFWRASDTGAGREDESHLRLDRLSYAWGGAQAARGRGEVGRFLQQEFPELGFLDGLELVRRVGRASTLGTSLGFLPVPDDLFQSGDDFQVALFGRYASSAERRLALGLAYQKSWHEGAADRDLVATQLEWHPAASTALFASALVDLYTSGDELKGAGPELTQLFVNATQRWTSDSGMGLFASRFRFPELLRDEFSGVTAAEIADAVNDRVGVDAWAPLGPHLALLGRLERWADEEDSGGGGRARLTWRDALGPGGPLTCEVHANDGKFSATRGLRVGARKRLEAGSLGLSWDATDFDQESVDEDLLQHAVRAELELGLGRWWFLALYAETRFGDEQDALSLGFTLQRRFDG